MINLLLYTYTHSQRLMYRSFNFHVKILQLSIPEGVSFEAMLCATVNAGHFFLQQPTHPTFHSLPSLTSKMSAVYSQDVNAPPLSHIDKGMVLFITYSFIFK